MKRITENNLVEIKPGQSITDGYRTYALGYDRKFRFISAGNHADYVIASKLLEEMISDE